MRVGVVVEEWRSVPKVRIRQKRKVELELEKGWEEQEEGWQVEMELEKGWEELEEGWQEVDSRWKQGFSLARRGSRWGYSRCEVGGKSGFRT